MTSSAPVMYAASSEARKTTSSATSSGVPSRLTSSFASHSASTWPGERSFFWASIGVSITPGCTELTRMFCGASSIAAVFVSPRTPHLLEV